MKYPLGPKPMLFIFIIGFIAGVYSLLMAPTHIIVSDWVDLIVALIWYIIMGLCTLGNAGGMLHQTEVLQGSEVKEDTEP